MHDFFLKAKFISRVNTKGFIRKFYYGLIIEIAHNRN